MKRASSEENKKKDDDRIEYVESGNSVFLLTKTECLDDYKNRGEDWSDFDVIGIYMNKSDAVAERTERMKKYVENYVRDRLDEDDYDKETVSDDGCESRPFKIFKKHFRLLPPSDDEEEPSDPEWVLKEDSLKNDLEDIFEELTKGEFCEQTLSYRVCKYAIR